VKAADELRRSEEQLDARIAALSTVDDSGREQAERDVLGALKEVMLKRRNALRAKDEAIKEMDAAVAVGAGEFARSMSLLIRSREQEAARLDAESALLASQEVVTRAAKDWKDAAERRRAAEEQLRKREAEFDVRDEALKARMSERDRLLKDLSVTV
jgi:aspartokinase